MRELCSLSLYYNHASSCLEYPSIVQFKSFEVSDEIAPKTSGAVCSARNIRNEIFLNGTVLVEMAAMP